MKYCLKYTNICTKLNKCQEISIKYIEDKGLVDFMKKFSSQRIILRVETSNFSNNEVRKLIAIKKQYPEYRFAVALLYFDHPLMSLFRDAGVPFFIDHPCTSWEEFNYLISQGVSDVNINGPLGFELSKVKRVLDSLDRKVIVRATPNKVENLCTYTDTLVGFYIRPNDIDLYENYIDVIEFEGLEYQDTFYDIYAKQKTFIGNLNQCIFNFGETKVDNKGLPTKLFGERRIDCGRECLNGGRCHRCYDLASLSIPMGNRTKDKIMETLEKEQEKMKSSEN